MRSYWKRTLAFILIVPFVLFGAGCGLLYWKQDAAVQQLILTLNQDFKGSVTLRDSHLSPFANLPYVSLDLEDLRVFESKDTTGQPVLHLQDIYLGFDLLSVLSGSVDIKSIRARNGEIRVVQHPDGRFNIMEALSAQAPIEDAGEEFHIHLKSILLENLQITKFRETDSLLVSINIDRAEGRFKSTPETIHAALQSKLILNVVTAGDTTFLRNKDITLSTELDFDVEQQVLSVQPSTVTLEKGEFGLDGRVDLDDSLNLDLNLHGNKPSFDLFLAFAPDELAPVLERYDNQGRIFFEATITGKAAGRMPLVVADFGCEDAFFNNRNFNRKLDDLFFKGHFSTGTQRDLSGAEFALLDVSAKPEAGLFQGYLKVKNFQSPEIDMKVDSELDLDFLAQFLEVRNLKNLKGKVALSMNFHDIIDLDQPEKAIERLNESYFTRLTVENLSFESPDFHLPVHDVDIHADLEGHTARLEYARVRVGSSDVDISGSISDLPAILHHTALPVTVALAVRSNRLDIRELTSGDTANTQPVNEVIENFSTKLHFTSSARAFTESPNLPVGEFFIDDLYAKLQNYPHTLHDFHADVFITDHDFRVIDFRGIIDKSDFHFSGNLHNYDLWFMEQPKGDTEIRFDLSSRLLKLEDLFAYGGQNYVPEDYRHEEITRGHIVGRADLHFQDSLHSADLHLDQLEGSLKVHPMRFEQFRGRVHLQQQQLTVENFSGKLGRSQFTANLAYDLGKATPRSGVNRFSLTAPVLDFDELFSFQPMPSSATAAAHDSVFNIYTVPFPNMSFQFDIDHLRYHRYQIDQFHASLRTQTNHYLYVDTLSMKTVGGQLFVSGYFNGSDPSHLYFNPRLRAEGLDLDKIMIKFDNFGQDHLVSENLHGKLSGTVSGKVRVHTDLVPVLNEADLQMDVEVVQGRLERYPMLLAMSEYFGDRNLGKVVFDTLRNTFRLRNGVMEIPAMTINSSLGFIEISGRQGLDMNMDLLVRVPWKLVTQAATQKLFGKKPEEVDPDREDAIQYRDPARRIRFVNVKVSGTPDDYKISLGKK